MKKRRTFADLWSLRLATVSVGPVRPDTSALDQRLLKQQVLLSQGSSGSGDEGRTVRAGRRRRTTSGDRERAEAPRRRRPDEQRPSPRPTGGSVRPPTSAAPRPQAPRPVSPRPSSGAAPGGSLPIGQLLGMLGGGRKSPLLIFGIIALFACFILAMFVLGPRDSGDGAFVQPTQPLDVLVQATSTPRPAAPTDAAGLISPPAAPSLV